VLVLSSTCNESNDPTEADVIAAAQDAINFARQYFQLTLDYSDKSIQDAEGTKIPPAVGMFYA